MEDQSQKATSINARDISIPPMDRVESSQLSAIGYVPATQNLFIRFNSKTEGKLGSLYRYDNVTQEQYDAFVAAESKGSWFGANIKHAKEAHPYLRVIED